MLVAVHGVGDQFNYETVQSVALRLAHYYGERAALPLGSFYEAQDVARARLLMSPPPIGLPPGVGFAEVYWADVARKVVRRGYQLEESKKWAKTIVARVAGHARTGALNARDYLLIENVLEELTDTVAVLERLCFVAEKAGVFKFNIQRILADFVNDVQLVADFSSYRHRILDSFDRVLATVAERQPSSEIYLVAHSEGTVVTLAALVRAIGSSPTPNWLTQVRGIMTIGSPLDTHVLLWPELWDQIKPQHPWRPKSRIPWLNYYDRGDPIADSLTSTEQWLDSNNCDRIFDIRNIGFSRYFFPGKAHIDYWEDAQVFGHFIEEVVGLPLEVPAPASAVPPRARSRDVRSDAERAPRRRFPKKPRSKFWPSLTCYVAPYGLIAGLLFVATYLLYRAVRTAAGWEPVLPPGSTALPGSMAAPPPLTGRQILLDVGALAALLAGVSVAVRIPRLSIMWRWRAFGAAAFVAGAAIYAWPLLVGNRSRALQDTIAIAFPDYIPANLRVWSVLIVAAIVTVVCAVLGRTRWNRAGVRTLLIVGGLAIVWVVVKLVWSGGDHGPLWPLALASIAFFYLWWLAVLLFDLVFVWHRYIRHSLALDDLRAITRPSVAGERH